MINIDELQVVNLLKELFIESLFPHPNVSEFHLLSYLAPLPPLFSYYRYIREITGVEILGRQKL